MGVVGGGKWAKQVLETDWGDSCSRAGYGAVAVPHAKACGYGGVGLTCGDDWAGRCKWSCGDGGDLRIDRHAGTDTLEAIDDHAITRMKTRPDNAFVVNAAAQF